MPPILPLLLCVQVRAHHGALPGGYRAVGRKGHHRQVCCAVSVWVGADYSHVPALSLCWWLQVVQGPGNRSEMQPCLPGIVHFTVGYRVGETCESPVRTPSLLGPGCVAKILNYLFLIHLKQQTARRSNTTARRYWSPTGRWSSR